MLAEKRGFGADGQWFAALGAALDGDGGVGGANPGWGLLAASAARLGLAYARNQANQAAAERGGCAEAAFGGFPVPPGAERKDRCSRWLVGLLILTG